MSIFGKDEVAMQKFSATLPVPEFDEDNFNRPKSLQFAKVALVTTAALYRTGGDGFKLGDSDFHYETFSRVARDLKLGRARLCVRRGALCIASQLSRSPHQQTPRWRC